jgi:hypothetical protein
MLRGFTLPVLLGFFVPVASAVGLRLEGRLLLGACLFGAIGALYPLAYTVLDILAVEVPGRAPS